MATPFGGGIGRWGEVCGAVVAGGMALGFCYGRTKSDESDKRNKSYVKAQDMLRAFENEFGSVQCRKLIGLNLMEPADRKKFDELGLRKKCAHFVAQNVENIRRILKEK